MKLVMAMVFLLASTFVQAKGGCDVELEGGLRITNQALEFTEGDKTRFKILNDQILIVDGRALNLDSHQQALVAQYAGSIRALVPEIHQLTLDGIDLASQAAGLVFQEFLGPENKTAKKIRAEFLLLRNDIEKNFASDTSLNINQKGFDDRDYFGMEFEKRIGNIIEASGEEISWAFVKSIGTAIFSNDKNGNFAARMNKFGEKIEHEMSARAEKMERRGASVCMAVSALDRKEEEFRQAIREINSFNLIRLKSPSQ